MDTERTIEKKKYVPDDDKDYRLRSISIDDAENGVVVTCCYKLTDEAQAKVKKSGGDTWNYDSCNNDEKRVFEDKADAQSFINDEVASLFSGE